MPDPLEPRHGAGMDASPEFPRQSRVPVFNMPRVVTLSIGLLMAIQALREFVLPDTLDIRVVLDLALVPARWTVWFLSLIHI